MREAMPLRRLSRQTMWVFIHRQPRLATCSGNSSNWLAPKLQRWMNSAQMPTCRQPLPRYMEEQGLGNQLVLGPDPQLGELDWQSIASLKCSQESPHPDGDTVITACYAAVADSGALVVVSSPDHPVELNFLPANHIVVLRRDQVLEDFEQLWTQLRQDYAGKPWPRCINLIVGPSRTADLGFPPKMGAHGPGRVHILVI